MLQIKYLRENKEAVLKALEKRNFKEVGGINVVFNVGVAGYIQKQLGSKEFRCVDDATGDVITDCRLVWDGAANAVGEVSIELTTGVYATKITGRKVRGSDGNVYKWDLEGDEDSTQGWNLSN